MLWRRSYNTLVARDQLIPHLTISPQPKVLIGAFSFRAIREITIWQRLVQKDAAGVSWAQVFFLKTASGKDESMVDAVVPPSQRGNTHLIQDSGEEWKHLIEPSGEEEAFACVLSGDIAKVIMKGLPTEEAWDVFVSELS